MNTGIFPQSLALKDEREVSVGGNVRGNGNGAMMSLRPFTFSGEKRRKNLQGSQRKIRKAGTE